MPPRVVAKERAWGTRYDSLGSWSESAPPSPELDSHPPSSPSHNKTTSVVHSPSLSQHTPEKHNPNALIPNATEKTTHDASIFVGSLPSHIEHTELTRMLSEHLADYPEIKSVKVVRDNKGGVCAFVQCEDAQSAARLIETLQTQPPRPFIGRYLRFEPARAFRTLLVSYRAPTQLVRAKPAPLDSGNVSGEAHVVPLEPATAMRIFRPMQSKFLAVTYNDEARYFDVQTATQTESNQTNDPFSGEGYLLAPLTYDSETMHRLALAFGPIEHFGEYVSRDIDEMLSEPTRIHPHDAPRSPVMAKGIWEIKWKHREDCVAAIMTLRRVPHITVTWLHQQLNSMPISGIDSRLSSPNVTPVPRLGPLSSPHRARGLQPYHASSSPTEYQRVNAIRTSLSQNFEADTPIVPFKIPISLSQATHLPSAAPESGAFISSAHIRGPLQFAPDNLSMDAFEGGTISSRWSESDFPPLHTGTIGGHFEQELTAGNIGPASDYESEPLASPSPSSSLSVQPATPVPFDTVEGGAAAGEAKHEDEQSNASPRSGRDTDVGQDLTVPPTPEHTLSSLTPVTPSSSVSYPLTPQSAHHNYDANPTPTGHVDVYNGPPYNSTPKRTVSHMDVKAGHQGDVVRHFDPFTIFVGGLDMYGTNTWDEVRLRSIFSKYGEIDDIQIVRPLAKRSAFAFVRYKFPDAGERAVAGEHNRAYDGHQIRVQLRENNHKSPAKFVRGRGRFPFPAPPEGEAVGVAMDKQVPVDTARGAANHGHIQDHSSSATQRINVNPIDLANTGHHTFTTFTVPHPYQSLPSPDTPSAPKERVMPYNPLRANSASTTNSASPSPSAVSQHQSSVSGAVPHYHYPMTMGYYPGQQWHYPAYPYAYPFMPTGYMPFAPPSYPSTPDNSGYPSAPYAGWVAVGDAQKNQATPANREQTPVHAYPQHTTQPPLRPTGFMQGEHGTLIPLYQPDALNRYMSTTTPQADRTATAQSSPTQQSTVMWPQYPQIPMYPYVYHPSSMVAPSHHQALNAGAAGNHGAAWTANSTPHSYGSQNTPHPAGPTQPHVPASASTATTAPAVNATHSYRHSIAGPVMQVPPQSYGPGYRQMPGTPSRRYQRRDMQFGQRHINPRDHSARFYKPDAPEVVSQ